MTGWTRLVIVLVAFIGIFASENKRIEQGTRAALDEYASLCPAGRTGRSARRARQRLSLITSAAKRTHS